MDIVDSAGAAQESPAHSRPAPATGRRSKGSPDFQPGSLLQEWRVIGPMTALNGALLMGWSPAVIFAVLSAKGDLPDLPERRGT